MQLRPGFDESVLTTRQSPCDQFNSIHSVNGHFILIIGVEMRPMVLCSRFGKHANNDSEKPRNFRHSFSCDRDSLSSRQRGRPHQVAVALAGGAASLVDRPHDETLPPPHVPGGEHPLDAGGEAAVLGPGVGNARPARRRADRAPCPPGRGTPSPAARDPQATLSRSPGPAAAPCGAAGSRRPFDLHRVQLPDVPVFIADEPRGVDQVGARVLAEAGPPPLPGRSRAGRRSATRARDCPARARQAAAA